MKFKPEKIIMAKTFEHNGLQYNFKYHAAKLKNYVSIFHYA